MPIVQHHFKEQGKRSDPLRALHHLMYHVFMNVIDAIILGIIEGLTEFFPISSTGHLIIAQRVFGIGESSLFFNTLIQLGAILAVLWFYRTTLFEHIQLFQKNKKDSLNGLFLLGIGSIPVLAGGFLFHSLVEEMQKSVRIVGIMSILIAGVFVLAQWWHKKQQTQNIHKKLGIIDMIVIGLFQTISIIPGVSRSGITIVGGLFRNLSFTQSANVAFALAVPAMAAASGYEGLKFFMNGSGISTDLLIATIVGFIAAFITAFATIFVTLPLLRKYGFTPFIIYRVIVGIALLFAF